MTEKDKITELERAITNKRAELSDAQQEKKNATGNAERLVLAEKHMKRVNEDLQALERAYTLAKRTPPTPTDRAELMKRFQKYRDEHAAKIEAVKTALSEAERERRETVAGLNDAADAVDVEKTLKLSERKAELDATITHLQEMRARVEALPVYPSGALSEEWENICDETLPVWYDKILLLETLAAEYQAACKSLLEMHDTLKAVRGDIERLYAVDGRSADYFRPVFTPALDTSKLTVNRADITRISNLASPVAGRAL